MEWADILKGSIGVVIGFLLTQSVNVVKMVRDVVMRPSLLIEPAQPDCVILSHDAQVDVSEYLEEEIYGFYIRNVGRSVATEVQFQLIKIEQRDLNERDFRTLSDHTNDLATYTHADGPKGAKQVTIPPNAAVLVYLAWWREDRDGIYPAIERLPDYYEESHSYGADYRFTVGSFGKNARHVTEALTLRDPHQRRKRNKALAANPSSPPAEQRAEG